MKTNQSIEPLLAIIPGAGGGVAMQVNGVFDCRRMPAAEADLAQLLRRVRPAAVPGGGRPVCLVELSDPVLLPDADRLGLVRGMVLALDYELVAVRPEQWQAALPTNHPAWLHRNDLQLKLRLQMAAKLFFPNLDITPGTATALAILLWGMRRDHSRRAVLVTLD